MTTPATTPARRTVHGVAIGILMLDTGFERLPGDIGHATTWPFPVQYRVVQGATGLRSITAGPGGTLDLFLEAAAELVAAGVEGIATSCGFLALYHQELLARCPVPVASSALLQVPFVQSMLPRGRRVGVLTADKAALTDAHFRAVGCPADLPVVGMPGEGVFRDGFRHARPQVDAAGQAREACGMARELLDLAPDLGAIVCECTNLAPHSAAIAGTVGLPVFDVVTMVHWLHAGIRPKRCPG
jgi:hypothetical protein